MKIKIDDVFTHMGERATAMLEYHVAKALGKNVYARSEGYTPDNGDFDEDEQIEYWGVDEDSGEDLYISDVCGTHYDGGTKLMLSHKISIVSVQDEQGNTTCTASMLCEVDGSARWIHSTVSGIYAVGSSIFMTYLKSIHGEEIEVV